MKYILFTSLIFLTTCLGADDHIACTEIFVYGLNVTVKNFVTGEIIGEGITIIATEDNYQEELMQLTDPFTFVGAGERAGHYILTISSNNYQNFTSESIQVDEDDCHVIPEVIEVFLSPN